MIVNGQNNSLQSPTNSNNFATYGIDKVLGNIEKGVDPLGVNQKKQIESSNPYDFGQDDTISVQGDNIFGGEPPASVSNVATRRQKVMESQHSIDEVFEKMQTGQASVINVQSSRFSDTQQRPEAQSAEAEPEVE